MKNAITFLLLSLLLFGTRQAGAEVVVVAGAKSGVERLSQQEVIYLFMGRWRQLPSGALAQPIDLASDSPERVEFYRRLVNKEPAEIRAYWSRLIFSGGSRPPATADNRESLIRQITSNPGAIGYLERSQVDSRLRIIFEFPTTP